MDSFEFELAQRFAQRALDMEPDNPRTLETCGVLFLELGEQEKAKHVSFIMLENLLVRCQNLVTKLSMKCQSFK